MNQPQESSTLEVQVARLDERLALNVADLTRRIEANAAEIQSLSRLVYGVALSVTGAFGIALLKLVTPMLGGP